MNVPTYNRKTVKQKITNELIMQIRDMCGIKTKAEIALIIGRSENTVGKICSRHGFSLRVKK